MKGVLGLSCSESLCTNQLHGMKLLHIVGFELP